MSNVSRQEDVIVVVMTGLKGMRPVFVWILTNVRLMILFVTKMPTVRTLRAVSNAVADGVFSATVIPVC